MTNPTHQVTSLSTLLFIGICAFATSAEAQGALAPRPSDSAAPAHADAPPPPTTAENDDGRENNTAPAALVAVSTSTAPRAADGGEDPPCAPSVAGSLTPTDAQILRLAQEVRERQRAERRAAQAPVRARRRRRRRVVLPIVGVVIASAIAGAAFAFSRRAPSVAPARRASDPDWCILYCD